MKYTHVFQARLEVFQLLVVDKDSFVINVFLYKSVSIFFVYLVENGLDRGITLHEHTCTA